MIAFLFGLSLPFVAGAVLWRWKGLRLIRVEKRNQAVQVVIWPGEWAIGCANNVRDYVV